MFDRIVFGGSFNSSNSVLLGDDITEDYNVLNKVRFVFIKDNNDLEDVHIH